MCDSCDSTVLLRSAGLRETANRRLVLDAVSAAGRPLNAHEVIDLLQVTHLNRVTIYRILDRLVEGNILNRLACPDRVDRYCLSENDRHPRHAHFFCTSCTRMTCLDRGVAVPEGQVVEGPGLGRVHAVQVLVDGVCPGCLKEQDEPGNVR